MYYFLNTKIAINKSGIEHAQIKRMNLFNENQIANKIVTRALVLNATDILEASRIPISNYLNMYDFFREETIEYKPFKLDDFDIPQGMSLEKKDNEYLLKENNNVLKIIMTNSENDSRISNIRLLSYTGKLVKTSWYDSRGFVGVEEIFDKKNELTMKQVLAPSGKVICQIFYASDKQGKVKPTDYQLIDYHGTDIQFDSEEDLMTFFLDELAKKDKDAVYIGDRATEYAYSLFNMKVPAFKVLVLHSSHVSDNENPLDSELNNNFYYSLNHLTQWDAIVTSTQAQKIDFTDRFGHESNTFAIPVGTIDKVIPQPFNERLPYNIGLVARLAPEKQQLQAVEAIKKVKESIPQIKLHLYGYSNENYGQKVKEAVKKGHLEDTVIFENYTDNINEVYKKMQLQLLTSSVEGFAMSILEGQANGVPQIAYNVKYGPKDIITDGEDGYLITPNDTLELANKIVFYFDNLKKAEEMSQNAYHNSQRYSKASVLKMWQPLFGQIKLFNNKKIEGGIK